MGVLSPNKTVTRIYSDEKNVQTTAFPSSGFSMSYQSRFDGILGRMIPAGLNFVMPHDKYQGVNAGAITMEHITTPNAPELQAHSYNFFTRFRSIDTGFEDLMSPSKLNNFSSTASLPIFTPSTTLGEVLKGMSLDIKVSSNVTTTAAVMLAAWKAAIAADSASAKNILQPFTIGSDAITTEDGWNAFVARTKTGTSFAALYPYMIGTYCSDVLGDFIQWATYTTAINTFGTVSADYRTMGQVIFDYIYKYLCMFIGEGSNMDFLGYPVTNRRTVRNANIGVTATVEDLPYLLLYGQLKADCKELPCNEYALRCLACIWICYFRNVQLEPLNADLRWRKWGSSSFLGNYADAKFWMLLTMRALPWAQDMVTSAMIDDIAEHVYAPIVNGAASGNAQVNTNANIVQPASADTYTNDSMHATLQSLKLNYYDHGTDSAVQINAVLPSSIGRFMSVANSSFQTSLGTLQLDLRTLKQAGMLERFLHRVFYFGDQYADAQKNFWMVDMSDATLFIPKLLSGGVSIVGQSQEVSNAGTDTTPQGTRTATMSGDMPSDPYSDFSEEFGCVINVVYVAPTVQYDPLLKQNLYRSYADFPNPVFAQDNESIMYTCEFSRSQANAMRPWGHVPYANEFRSRLNSVHGKFIDEYADWTINRFFGSDANSIPNLNWQTLHMSGMQLGCFDSNVLLEGQFYVLGSHNFNVERLLPAPVEYC